MIDLQMLKIQEKQLTERIDLLRNLIELRKKLKIVKARSAFTLERELGLNIFKFEPNEWIELVGEG